MNNSTLTETKIGDLIQAILVRVITSRNKLMVDPMATGRTIFVTVRCAKGDASKVIGKGGKHLDALKAVLEQVGVAQGYRVRLKLEEPEGNDPTSWEPYKPDPNWNGVWLKNLATKLAEGLFSGPVKLNVRDSGRTTTVISISAEEPQVMLREPDDLQAQLETIFQTIGKANGRELAVLLDVRRADVAEVYEQPQPVTNKGRFFGEA